MPNINSDLANIISNHSTIFIKSYGVGTLATPSFRGTSAQHTQVEWNGINLNSPMLGQIDFSQVPVSQFDGLDIYYGAAGITKTSGAFGGVIDLVTQPDWMNSLNAMLSQQLGSFGYIGTNANLAAGTSGFQAHIKLNYRSALNNFPYTNSSGDRVDQMNASFSQTGLSQEMFWRLGKGHLISAKFWYSQDHRNLPPTTETNNPDKKETIDDKALRGVLEYKIVEKDWNILVRTAMNEQFMIYENNFPEINSAHHSTSFINRLRFSYSGFGKLILKPGIDYTWDHVRSDEYESGSADRHHISLFLECLYEINPRIKTSLVIREDVVDGTAGKPIPAIGLEYLPLKSQNLSFTANLARNYRYPSLNDLYWQNAGSTDLQPEENYSMELGTAFSHWFLNRQVFFETILTGYYSWIYDMIVWYPVSGSSLFRPANVKEILARGVEFGLNMEGNLSGFKLGFRNNYNFCRSTTENETSTSGQTSGKQQLYTPVHTFNSTISAEKWNFYFQYIFYIVSSRFTNNDNLMPGYALSDIILGRNLTFGKNTLSLQLDINNLFNLDYQSIASRPMPGINCMFTLKYFLPGKN